MSYSNGRVVLNGQVVGHFLYYDTVERIADTAILPSAEALEEFLLEGDWDWKECTCKCSPTRVFLWVNDIYWPAHVCLTCKVLIAGFEAWDCENNVCLDCNKVRCTDDSHHYSGPISGYPT